jgi:hypothetical protein
MKNLTRSPRRAKYKRKQIGIYYNFACNHALFGNKEEAFTFLEKSVESGFADAGHKDSDGDLKLIRNEKRFMKLTDRLKREHNLREYPFIYIPFRINISEH